MSNKIEDNEIISSFGIEYFKWQIPEYDKHARSRRWYFLACTIAFLLLFFSLQGANFLFAIIIILAAFIIIMREGKDPEFVDFAVYSEGLAIGSKFFDYDEIKNFSVMYKSSQDLKNLYFEFNSFFKPRLSIPLLDANPLQIRETLLKYLKEDLERTDRPVSEQLARLLKL